MIFTAYKLLDVVQFRVFCLTGPIQVHQYYNIQKYNIPTVTYVSQTWTLALKSKKKKKKNLLKVFVNRAKGKRLESEKLYNVYSPIIIRITN
jgi:hypothetical protein